MSPQHVEGCVRNVFTTCSHRHKETFGVLPGLPGLPGLRVWQCDTKALVISVLTTLDMLYSANDLSPSHARFSIEHNSHDAVPIAMVEYRM